MLDLDLNSGMFHLEVNRRNFPRFSEVKKKTVVTEERIGHTRIMPHLSASLSPKTAH